MIRSEKLKNLVIESTHQPPHENRLLLDLPGEIWKLYPHMPDFYAVSNKGRVKILEREYLWQNSYRVVKERILKQRVQVRKNSYANKQVYIISVVIFCNGVKRELSVPRMVYETFVATISDSKFIVGHIDDNAFNNAPENLYLYHKSDLNNKLIVAGCRKPQALCYRKNPVSQYDLKGQLVATYNSRMEATRAMGITSTKLSHAIKKRYLPGGGFFWRDGIAETPRIEIPPVKKRSARCRKVAQYSLDGNLIHVFPSVKIAAASINISPYTLYSQIKKHISPKGFIWKIVDDSKKVPRKIIIEPFVPVKKWSDTIYDDLDPIEYEYPFQNYSLQDMPGEQWKEIPDTGSSYFLSNYGRVKATDRIIQRENTKIWQKGYIIHQAIIQYKGKSNIKGLSARFSINKKHFQFYVSRQVYTLFIGQIPPKYVVKQIDGNPLNCRAENLELRSLSDVMKQYSQQGRLSGSSLHKPIAQYTLDGVNVKIYPSLQDAAGQTGLSASKISECVNGKREKYKGYFWKYL